MGERVLLVSYLGKSLRQQRTPDAQKAIADAISGLSTDAPAAKTGAEELRRMPHNALTVPVPLALVGRSSPEVFKEVIEVWAGSPDASDLVRNASRQALGEA